MLKSGSGMSSFKQFMLSLLATTVSIALTFGTAAIVEHNKKEKEKREIVMMVMYDMYNSLQSVAKSDSMIRKSIDWQCEFAENPSLYEKNQYLMINLIPIVNFTETVEHIFSSNIETINTLGNILFAENVANFYLSRKSYKTAVCDSVYAEVKASPFHTLENILDFDYCSYSMLSGDLLSDMQILYKQCQKMMKIDDKQLEVYRKKRDEMNATSSVQIIKDSLINRMRYDYKRLEEAKKKYKSKKKQ